MPHPSTFDSCVRVALCSLNSTPSHVNTVQSARGFISSISSRLAAQNSESSSSCDRFSASGIMSSGSSVQTK